MEKQKTETKATNLAILQANSGFLHHFVSLQEALSFAYLALADDTHSHLDILSDLHRNQIGQCAYHKSTAECKSFILDQKTTGKEKPSPSS